MRGPEGSWPESSIPGPVAEGPYLTVRMALNGGQLNVDAEGNLPVPFVLYGLEIVKAQTMAQAAVRHRAGGVRTSVAIPVRKADMPRGD